MYLLMAYFTIHHWLTLQTSGYFSRKMEIWKHDDYHINIHSILTFNGFLVIYIHMRSCRSDFLKYLSAFTPLNNIKHTGLVWIEESGHFYGNHSICKYQFTWSWRLFSSPKIGGLGPLWGASGHEELYFKTIWDSHASYKLPKWQSRPVQLELQPSS